MQPLADQNKNDEQLYMQLPQHLWLHNLKHLDKILPLHLNRLDPIEN